LCVSVFRITLAPVVWASIVVQRSVYI